MRRTITAIPVLCSVMALGLTMALTACGSNAPEQASQGSGDTPAATDATPGSRPPAMFALCQSCHSVQPGRNGIGPSLAGMVGRKAASVEGFSYSPALRAANLTWDRTTLDQWLAGPMKMVPGTRMVYAGMVDPAKRQEMIDYMETLR